MAGDILYLDSSALVKLVLPEPETPALLACVAARPHRVSSEVAVVEVRRAARRASPSLAVRRRAEEVLAGVHLVRVGTEIFERAAKLDPPTLRSLDAVHLTTGLSLGSDLGAFVAYDEALVRAARANGLPVLSPK